MHDEQSFIRAICEQPGEDAIRLVFADWLDEQGRRDQVLYIRNAIALASVESCEHNPYEPVAGCRCCDAYQTDRKLTYYSNVDPGTLQWQARSHIGLPNSDQTVLIHLKRGFGYSLNTTLEEFHLHAGFLFASHPIVEVNLFGRHPLYQRDTPAYWKHGPEDHRQFYLPMWLFSLIRQFGTPDPSSARPSVAFATPEDAKQALSDVCVSYGRNLVGLPELKSLIYRPRHTDE